MLNLDETGLKRLKPSRVLGTNILKPPSLATGWSTMASYFTASLKIVIFLPVDIHSVFADLSGQ